MKGGDGDMIDGQDNFFSAPPKREKAEGKSAPRLAALAGLGLGVLLMPPTGSGPASTRLGNSSFWVVHV